MTTNESPTLISKEETNDIERRILTNSLDAFNKLHWRFQTQTKM